MSSPENIFITTKDAFETAYSSDTKSEVQSVGPNHNEMIRGNQTDGKPIAIFRPNIGALGGESLFTVIMGNPIFGKMSEFVVGGGEDDPISFEVITREPLESRNLSQEEMAELAQKIGASIFD